EMTQNCTGGNCKVHGGWSPWTQWSACSSACQQHRQRTCTAPTPQNGGRDCSGDHEMTQTCTGGNCKVHGGWSPWTQWSACSSACQQQRQRTCTAPTPQNGGR
ncbi:unnamed protein product, partial [Meganyctiphanes norvegica]